MLELLFVRNQLTTRLLSVTFFTILEKVTCSITSTSSEPVRPLAEFSQPNTNSMTRNEIYGLMNCVMK